MTTIDAAEKNRTDIIKADITDAIEPALTEYIRRRGGRMVRLDLTRIEFAIPCTNLAPGNLEIFQISIRRKA